MTNQEILQKVLALRHTNTPHAIATVVEVVGSTSAKTGSKALIAADGRVLAGWVGGGCAESTACHAALACMQSNETTIINIDLDDEVLGAGMPCGGHMRVYIEPFVARSTIWIVGHGAIAEHLCTIAAIAEYNVAILDTNIEAKKFPAAHRLIDDDYEYDQLAPSSSDFVVIATQHKGDHLSVIKALKSDARYIGLIASQKRALLVKHFLRDKQFSDVDQQRVISPCGLDIGAQTPAEIALSILSEIVMIHHGAEGNRLNNNPQRAAEVPRLVGND